MKKNVVLSTLFSSLFIAHIAAADTVAKWTFETSPPADLIDSTTISGILADVGAGTASGVHASAVTDWTTPVGNGSTNSLSANTWAIGDYYQFSVSTVSFEDIMLSWSQTSSGTGPGEFTFAYQINGGGFTDYLNYTVLPNQVAAPGLGSWGSLTEILGYNYSVDLSAVSALDNVTAVDFRLTMRTTADSAPPGAVAVAGTSRVDNFTVTALPVPEPAVGAILCGFGLLGLFMSARRR
jgi:hypothetical protein